MCSEEKKKKFSDHNILLSICIGTYNRKELLLGLLDELARYPGDAIEVIVCDNASTDGTWEALQKVTDNRFHICRNPENYGAEYNWLKTLWMGNGKYLMNLNDRSFIDLNSLDKVLSLMEKTDAGAIVTCGMKENDRLKVDSYENRACTMERLGEPGDIIYSGWIVREIKKDYGDELQKDDTYKMWGILTDRLLSAENWYWFSEVRLVKGNPTCTFSKIKVNRVSRGYIFTGCPEGQRGICIDKLDRVSYISPANQEKYVRGIVKAYARTFFWTTWNSYHNESICKRYEYVPPRHTFWIKETLIWQHEIIKTLKKENYENADVFQFIKRQIWEEYKEFSYYRLTQTRIVKMMVRAKHAICKE